MPAGQGVHADEVAPPVEYLPGAQRPEQAAVASPGAEPKVPLGQGVQAAEVAPANE